MAVFRVSEAEAARDFAVLLSRVRAGEDVVIESSSQPIAVLQMPRPLRRSVEQCIALLPAEYSARIDEDFARDVQAAVDYHRESLNPPEWD